MENNFANVEQILISWRAKSRLQKPMTLESSSTIIVLGSLIALVLAFAQEWMLLLLIASGIFFNYAWNRVPADEMEFSITSRGFRAFGNLYDWTQLNRWWWEEKYGSKIIALETNHDWLKKVFIPIGTTKSEDVEAILAKYLINEKPKQTLMDKISDWMTKKFPLDNKI